MASRVVVRPQGTRRQKADCQSLASVGWLAPFRFVCLAVLFREPSPTLIVDEAAGAVSSACTGTESRPGPQIATTDDSTLIRPHALHAGNVSSNDTPQYLEPTLIITGENR